MLDDLNKIVPKLEDDDKNNIYQNINNKSNKKISFRFNPKLITVVISFVIIAVLIIPTAIIIGNKSSGEKNASPKASATPSSQATPSGSNTNIDYGNDYHISDANIIGMAAYSEFDSSNTNTLNNFTVSLNSNKSLDTVDETKVYTYSFDYVQINSAYKFSINVDDITDTVAKEMLEENCGVGELEVVVADFETFNDANGSLSSSVVDTMISLRGYNGYYTILLNNGSYNDSYDILVFSSHKKLTSDSVEKDFTPPVLSIFLKETNNTKYVYFKSSDYLLSTSSYDQSKAYKNIADIEYVDNNTLYSVLNITKLELKTITATVVEIDYENNYFLVTSDGNLEYVFFDDNTTYSSNGSILPGTVIHVTYNSLYSGYNPHSVIAFIIAYEQIN